MSFFKVGHMRFFKVCQEVLDFICPYENREAIWKVWVPYKRVESYICEKYLVKQRRSWIVFEWLTIEDS